MEYLHLYFRIICAVFLLSSSFTHLKYNKKFIYDFTNYNIISKKFVKPITHLMVFSELLIGTILITGYFKKFSYIGGFLLFLVFNIAMTINLVKNNKIKCGCGGLLGDRIISWKLVVRNFIFMSVFFYLFVQDKLYVNNFLVFLNESGKFDINAIITIFSIIATLLIYTTFSNILNIKRKLLDEFK